MKMKKLKLITRSCLMMIYLSFNSILQAKPVLPLLFTDNMVFQQKAEAPIWGNSKPGQSITVTGSWDNKLHRTTADADGKWKLKVQTPVAGGPYTITVSDGESITLNNVMIGEVWLCSGQSNMEMPLAGWGKVKDYEQEISNTSHPSIRLFQVEKQTALSPSTKLKAMGSGWLVCSPQTIPEFSATAYFFAKSLSDSLGNIPIGLIHSSWGGTPAEAWTSEESLTYHPGYSKFISTINKLPKDEEGRRNYVTEQAILFQQEIYRKDNGYKKEMAIWAGDKFNDKKWQSMHLPGFWEQNGLPDFDGIVWFRKTIELNPAWLENDLILNLGMIDDNDITYFNGTQIGNSEGWMNNRQYNVPAELIRKGKNTITIRAYDSGGGGGIHGDAANMYIQSGDMKINISGAWKYSIGLPLKELNFPAIRENQPSQPASLFNGMINPILPYTIGGAIWYQGEANVGRAVEYSTLFPLMIQDWRTKWGYDFPFYFVQLANFMKKQTQAEESDWAALREAQQQALFLENTGMTVIIDIGEADDIHPKNKQEVGRRLALLAMTKSYGYKTNYSGPTYKTHEIKGATIITTFDHADSGLKTSDGLPPKGFYIAGADKKFYPAEAVITGDKITLSNRGVKFPFYIRYGWADNPDCNLINGVQLPAAPFRTDK
jgi:sialate O-acetylesterase